MPKTLSVHDGYTRWATTYDEPANPLIRLEQTCLSQTLSSLRPASVLDAATGTGRHALWFAQQGAAVVGIDATCAMLEIAERKRRALGLSNVRFIEARLGEQQALVDETFDLVVCALALCHVARLDIAIASLARAVRPGGSLVISDLHPAAVAAGLGTLFTQGRQEYAIETVAHRLQDYTDAIRAAGADIVEMQEAPLGDAATSPAGLPRHLVEGDWQELPFCLTIRASVPDP